MVQVWGSKRVLIVSMWYIVMDATGCQTRGPEQGAVAWITSFFTVQALIQGL